MTFDSFEYHGKKDPNVKIVQQKGNLISDYKKPNAGQALILVRTDPENPFEQKTENVSRQTQYLHWTKKLSKGAYQVFEIKKTLLKK